MNNTPHSEWYVKAEDGALGPFSPQELIQQACMGQIVGTDELSAKTEGPWLTAESLEALELDWQVKPEEGDPLPRCHVLALRNWVEEEKVQPYWDITHLPSGEVYDVVDALCSALLAQNHLLEERLSTSAHPVSSDHPSARGQDLQIELDHSKKEATKWQRLYEDEIKRNESREQELLQDNETLRAWQRKAAERIKALQRRQATLDESRQLPNASGPLSGDKDLASAYEELKLQMTHLLDSLQLKSRQLDEAREQNRELTLQIRSARKEAEEKVDRVSELHEDTLDQLNKLEQAHVHLSRSFRELNDRLIQLRNQNPSPARTPVQTSAPKAEAAPKPAAAQTPPPPEKPGGPVKIKMT
ncbi:hypothetical protein P0Y35_18370 [Kiritimatiellaeota bacterium B1221]|nr:hypothetical protein [Kiritimatiellaeota bacterium B1221]